MGQYFKAVNLDKREVVCPWCLGGGAKLWEWAVNGHGAIFTLLLRKSSGTGGGDYDGSDAQFIEGMSAPVPATSVVGRWAGDRVVLIGDYDDEFEWCDLEHYTNITERLVEEWNRFVDNDNAKLEFDHCGCLSPLLDSEPQS